MSTAVKPKYDVGEIVHTKVTVVIRQNVGIDGRGRPRQKSLALIPGADWVVLSSEVPEGKRRHYYRLRCKPYEVVRREGQLRGTGRRAEG